MSFEALHVIGHLWFWVLLGSALFLALYSWQFGLDDTDIAAAAADARDDPTAINEKADFSADADTGSSSQRHKTRRSQQRMLKSQHQQQQNNTFRTGDFLFGVLPNAALIKWREIDRK